MKKMFVYSIIIAFLFLQTPLQSHALAANSAILTKIENDIYGYDYSKDNNASRIARLEKTVYGKVSSGDVDKRIKKLSGDISADVIGLEIEPVKDTFLAEENAKEESGVDYPVVNEIEQKIFNKTYKNRDFHSRIVAIERKLFGKIYDVDDYSVRMDRIKEKMGMETSLASSNKNDGTIWGDGSYYNSDMINSMDLSGTSRSRFANPFGQRNYTRKYTNYGNYSSEFSDNKNLSDELAQIEYDTFGTEFSGESTQSRLKRLNSVNKAKKSSKKYDSQKFNQHMSTAMEIGAMILMILAMVL